MKMMLAAALAVLFEFSLASGLMATSRWRTAGATSHLALEWQKL